MNAACKSKLNGARWLLLGPTLAVLCSCTDQPKPSCAATGAPFVLKLIERTRVESSAGACGAFGPDSFNADPQAGVTAFFQRDDKGQPDYEDGSVAIQTSEVGTLLMNAAAYGVENSAPDGVRYSLGDFSVTGPNADDLCPAPELSTTRVVLAEVPAVEDDPATEDEDESFPGQPAVDITLEWSNFLLLVTPANLGNQIQADLTDTRRTPEGETCTIEYRAVGLAPAVSCAALDPEGAPMSNDDGTPMLDPTACDPEANPEAGRVLGSGISPAADFECDPVIAFCVLKGDSIPAVR